MTNKYETDSKEQRSWDKILLAGWVKDAPVRNLMFMMLRDFHEKGMVLDRLRRFPHGHDTASSVCARRFVAAYLPKLSDKLWDGATQADALFYLYLNGDKIDTLDYEVDSHKRGRERKWAGKGDFRPALGIA